MMKKQAYNPYLPAYEYIPDGEPRVFGDRLYIFGTHDRFDGDDYCLNDYVSWSAPVDDLASWRYEGVIFRRDQSPYPGNLFAPDVVQGPDGRYYLYFSSADSGITGVAVCETPAGAYRYIGDVRTSDGHVLGSVKTDWFNFDPAVLVDDDGRVWLYSGSGQKSNEKFGFPVVGAFVVELATDMMTVISEPRIIMHANEDRQQPNFFEASSIRKINGLYYFVYFATDISGLNYCTSRYPDRDFVWRGIIHSSSDIGLSGRSLGSAAYPIGNNHGGLVCVQGQWYIFNHRMTNRTFYSRQGIAEPVTIAGDGTIAQTECTSSGLNNGPLTGRGEYPAIIACNLMGPRTGGFRNPMTGPYITQSGDDRESDPDSYITAFKNDCVAGFKYFLFKGSNQISLILRGDFHGLIRVCLDEEGKQNVAVITVRPAVDWQNFNASLSIPDGVHPLFLIPDGVGSLDLQTLTLK